MAGIEEVRAKVAAALAALEAVRAVWVGNEDP